jgi:hypothetical protein
MCKPSNPTCWCWGSASGGCVVSYQPNKTKDRLETADVLYVKLFRHDKAEPGFVNTHFPNVFNCSSMLYLISKLQLHSYTLYYPKHICLLLSSIQDLQFKPPNKLPQLISK